MAPFNSNKFAISIELFSAATSSGVKFSLVNLLYRFKIMLFKNNNIIIFRLIISVALISAPFDINSSPISTELFFAAI